MNSIFYSNFKIIDDVLYQSKFDWSHNPCFYPAGTDTPSEVIYNFTDFEICEFTGRLGFYKTSTDGIYRLWQIMEDSKKPLLYKVDPERSYTKLENYDSNDVRIIITLFFGKILKIEPGYVR